MDCQHSQQYHLPTLSLCRRCLTLYPNNKSYSPLQTSEGSGPLEVWASIWGMQFNPSKFCTPCICKAEDPKFYHLYTLCNVILEHKQDNPYLVIQIGQNMSFNKHIYRTSQQKLGLLNRNFKSCPTKLKEIASSSQVRSKLEYKNPIWDPHLTKKSISWKGSKPDS